MKQLLKRSLHRWFCAVSDAFFRRLANDQAVLETLSEEHYRGSKGTPARPRSAPFGGRWLMGNLGAFAVMDLNLFFAPTCVIAVSR